MLKDDYLPTQHKHTGILNCSLTQITRLVTHWRTSHLLLFCHSILQQAWQQRRIFPEQRHGARPQHNNITVVLPTSHKQSTCVPYTLFTVKYQNLNTAERSVLSTFNSDW